MSYKAQGAQLVNTPGGTQSHIRVTFKGLLTARVKIKMLPLEVTSFSLLEMIKKRPLGRILQRDVSVGELKKPPSKSPSHSEIFSSISIIFP